MTDAKHTPLRLSAGDETRIFDADNLVLCDIKCGGMSGRTVKDGERIADRIVACVNACEGITDPSVVPELVAFVADFIAVMNRDGFTGDEPDRLHGQATAILAKMGAAQ